METSSSQATGSNFTQIASALLEQVGGVSGLVKSFERNGISGIMESWIGAGANQPISTEQIGKVFGAEKLAALASKFGLTPDTLQEKLSQFLPKAVDNGTPDGKLPNNGISLSNILSMAEKL